MLPSSVLSPMLLLPLLYSFPFLQLPVMSWFGPFLLLLLLLLLLVVKASLISHVAIHCLTVVR